MCNFGITLKIPERYLGRDFEKINKALVLDYFDTKSQDEKSTLVLIFIKVNEACIIHSLYNIFRRDPDWLLASVFLHLSKFFPKLHPDKIGNRNPLHSIKWVYADVKRDLGHENNFGLSKRNPFGGGAYKPSEGCYTPLDSLELAYIPDMDEHLDPVGLGSDEIPAGKTR